MAYEMNDMSGSLFRNTKRDNDRQPEFNGSCKIDGREMWISGWVRETKDGGKYFSLAFKPKDAQPQREQPRQAGRDGLRGSPQAPARYGEDLDDPIPF